MEKVREIIQYKNYFEEFLLAQPSKVQDKIFKVLEIIETYERVPATYLKSIAGTKGLYETRIKLGSNIWRVFCFFDQGKLLSCSMDLPKKRRRPLKRKLPRQLI